MNEELDKFYFRHIKTEPRPDGYVVLSFRLGVTRWSAISEPKEPYKWQSTLRILYRTFLREGGVL